MRSPLTLWNRDLSSRGRDMISPWQSRMERVFDDFFGDAETSLMRSQAAFNPSCDIDESEEAYRLTFDIPGISKDRIQVQVENGRLTVSGEREDKRSEREKGETHRSERFFGRFERIFTLPSSVDAEAIEASYKDGVLEIALPKTQTAKSRQIPIGEQRELQQSREPSQQDVPIHH